MFYSSLFPESSLNDPSSIQQPIEQTGQCPDSCYLESEPLSN